MITLINRLRPRADRRQLPRAFLLLLLTFSATRPSPAKVTHDFRLFPDPQSTVSSQRAYFVYEAFAGDVIDDAVLVRNESDVPQRLSLFPADAMTASHGGVAVATRLK